MAIKVNPRCFFDVASSDGNKLGRIVFELFADHVPKTVENFRCLCTGEKASATDPHRSLHYRNSTFHSVIPQFMIQGGDFTQFNGTGGESIYGRTFEDENLDMKHDKPFLLSMANRGPGTNSSQFFITLKPCPHLDGKHVVFGRVVSGHAVVEAMEQVQTDDNDKPLVDLKIGHCGELELKIPQEMLKKLECDSDKESVTSGSSGTDSSYERRRAEKKEKKRIKREERERRRQEKHEKKALKKLEKEKAVSSAPSVSGLASEKRYELPPGTEFKQVYGLHDDRLFSLRYQPRRGADIRRRFRSPVPRRDNSGQSYYSYYHGRRQERSRSRSQTRCDDESQRRYHGRSRSRSPRRNGRTEKEEQPRQFKGRGAMRYRTPPHLHNS